MNIEAAAQDINRSLSNPFDSLPDALLARILSEAALQECFPCIHAVATELCQYRTVCSRFRRVALQVQNIGWELLDPNGSREESLLKFLTDAGHIRGFFIWTDIDGTYVASPGFLAAVLGAVPQLETLGFQGRAFNRGESEEICHQLIRDVSALPHLQTLRFQECYLRLSTALSLPQPLARLRRFSLSCDVITDVALESLLQHCPCLESLELGQCVEGLITPIIESTSLQELTFVTMDGLESLDIKAPQLILLACFGSCTTRITAPLLKKLDLRGPTASNFHCRSPWELDVLSLWGCWEGEGHLAHLLRTCGRARSVILGGTFFCKVTQHPAHYLEAFCQVEELHLGELPVAQLTSLSVPHFSKLKKLTVDLAIPNGRCRTAILQLVEKTLTLETFASFISHNQIDPVAIVNLS
jgi:hypothetical protein